MQKEPLGIKRIAHAATGGMAGILIFSFLLATIYVEMLGGQQQIAFAKQTIVFPGIFILIPLLATTGGIARTMQGTNPGPAMAKKMKRMKIIAALGIFILTPSAWVLFKLSISGNFGPVFIAIQTLEIIAGIINLTLLTLNAKDGILLSRQRRQRMLDFSEAKEEGLKAAKKTMTTTLPAKDLLNEN